jgi:hypothetical protein
VEYYRSVVVQQYPVLRMIFDGLGKNDSFNVSANVDKISDGASMTYPFDALFYNGTFVQFGGDIVGSSPDEFDPVFKRLVVGPCALESR